MADLGESWTTQQLVEFLAAVSSFPDERSAVCGAAERAAEALEAEVGAVVQDRALVACVGFPADDPQTHQLVAAAEGMAPTIEVPGAGTCATISVALEDGALGQLVLARGGGEAFSRQEVNLLRGMARVLALALQALRVVSNERALRERSDEQAQENATLLARLQERQALLERLSRIQRAIVQRTNLSDVLDAIVAGVGELLAADAVGLRLLDPEHEECTVLVACSGLDAHRFPIGGRAPLGDGTSGLAMVKEQLVVARAGDGDADASAALSRRGLASAMAAPVIENGRVVGALAAGSHDSGRDYSRAEQDVLLALAEHASLALTDAKNYGTAMHRASHDMLTGLPNRALFLDRLEHAAKNGGRDGRKLAVLFLDLDGFKRVNDSFGHGVGDRLLVAVAERLRESVRPGDTLARFGGDEFTILLDGIYREEDAAIVARRAMSSLHSRFRIEGKDVSISVSVGVATLREPGEDLLRNADLAMYQAKGRGKGMYELFDPTMHSALVERLRLEADLGRAVERREFELAYQPIVELRSGAMVAVEALVRWRHPDRGLLAPAMFIATAEETGLIRAIGREVLEQACMQGAALQRRYPSVLPLAVAVNLSVNQIQHPQVIDEVAHALERSGLDPGSLILEITETLLMQDLERGALARLKQLGVQIAVDDFGTGYSSLQYLRRFPIDILKIDKSFVDGIDEPDELALARAIVDLGESLNLRVIAEGVERAEQVSRLLELGCRWGQGYLFGRPTSALELERLLARHGAEGWPPVALADSGQGLRSRLVSERLAAVSDAA